MLHRRSLLLGLASLALPWAALAQDFAPAPDAGYDAWVRAFRKRALARGIPAATLSAAFRHAGFLPGVIAKDRAQAEHIYGLEDYLAITASAERVAMGRKVLVSYGGLLRKIEARYGVEARVVAAIWGIESFYGTKRGTVPVISALSTLAYEGRRASFFEGQLMAALQILAHGDISADRMTGGWAGAMGHTQFIPTTYLSHAVDWNGDGRRDVWSDDPADALASSAHYLKAAGWIHGSRWGMEVSLPKDAGTQVGKARKATEWRKLGLMTGQGGRLPDIGTVRLIRPDTGAPAFLVGPNFRVIGRYNASTLYCLAVGHLSDRIAGSGPLAGDFAPDANGLTQADRVELQQRLTALGFDTGSTDGVLGPKTSAAVSGWQKSQGLPVTGIATPDVLSRLR